MLLITIIRTFIMYIIGVGTLRLMGKRQIGELEPSELVVTIIISEIAAMPITDTGVALIPCIIAILTLMVLEIMLSFFAFKNPSVRTFLYGRPSMFYRNGKFDQAEMLKQRFNVADIMEEIRGNGFCSLDDIEYIVMETNGKVSVIQKQEKSAVSPELLKIKTEPARMSYIIIDNGTLIKGCMKQLNLNEEWLKKTLSKHRVKKVKDVFYMSYEKGSGDIMLIPKERER